MGLDPWLGSDRPLVTLYAAVAVAVSVGGYAPALPAAILGYFACDYLFMEPRGVSHLAQSSRLAGLAGYLVSCAAIILIGEAMRRAWRDAEHARQDALGKQRQLEQAGRERDKAMHRKPISPPSSNPPRTRSSPRTSMAGCKAGTGPPSVSSAMVRTR